MSKAATPRLALLASNRGSNVQAILTACQTGRLDAAPVVVISNNPAAGALEYARQAGLPALHLVINAGAGVGADQCLLQMLREHRVDWVLLAGYLWRVGPQVLAAYQGHILNIHPGPLPEFGGKGMYGLHVHRAVLASGRPETAAVIHQVEEGYDTGPVLAERPVPVAADDTPEVLAARVLQTEHALYVDTLREILCGKLLVL